MILFQVDWYSKTITLYDRGAKVADLPATSKDPFPPLSTNQFTPAELVSDFTSSILIFPIKPDGTFLTVHYLR